MGKTIGATEEEAFEKKHPHVHGEDTIKTPKKRPSMETPPRAWGRLARHKAKITQWRNTPTCMGKTWIQCIV